MGKDNTESLIAVADTEVRQYGCPYCGYRSGFSTISARGTTITTCGECSRAYAVLTEGLNKSLVGLGDHYPKLQPHPRQGIPAHGRPDIRPGTGGEFFSPRGIGLESGLNCFVCGGEEKLRNNVAAFVHCKAAGERVVEMFQCGARLDYREHSPDRVQVKIGACDKHLPNLELLCDLTHEGGIIAEEMIATATSL